VGARDGELATSNRGWFRAALCALLWLGFAARVWRLGAQSLWLDEAISVIFARPAPPALFQTLITQDIHPPLYYLLLHYWMGLVGQGEFAVRYLSLITGLPAISATYVLGTALFRRCSAVQRSAEGATITGELAPVGADQRALRSGALDRGTLIGALGALLLTFSPFMVYYSQEARMYSALATFAALSSYCLWKLLATGQSRWWWGYAACTTLMMYTQYFGSLVIAFQVLYLLGWLVHDRARASSALGALAVTGVAYVPWLPGAYAQMQRLLHIPDFWKGAFPLSFMLDHIFGAFVLGQFGALQHLLPVALVIAGLGGAGLAYLVWQALRRGGGELFVLLFLLVPFVILYEVLVRDPKFTERYLIMIVPPFYLVLALGLVTAVEWIRSWPHRWVRTVGYLVPMAFALALVGASLSQLEQVYNGPGYRKDDNRGAVAYIEQHWQPGDVVVLMMNTSQSFLYYSDGKLPWAALQPGGDLQGAANRMNQIFPSHRRAWVLLWNAEWADPTDYVRDSLASAYRELPVDQQFAGLQLQLYAIDPAYRFTVRTTPEYPDVVNFGNRIQLLGYDLPSATIAAGQTGHITFYWKALAPLQADYIVSLRLVDRQFYWWRHDSRPAAYNYPTMYWRPGQVVSGQLSFSVPPDTPPGNYQLEVGVYGQGVGSDLDVLQAGTVPIGTAQRLASIQVVSPDPPVDPAKLDIPNPTSVTFGAGLRLLGSSLQQTPITPGGTMNVTVWWQSMAPALPAYQIQLILTSGDYQRVVDAGAPDAGRYATTAWTPGEVVQDRHQFLVPADTPPGKAEISLRVLPAGAAVPLGVRGTDVALGTAEVLDRHLVMAVPPGIQVPTNWRVGTFAHLVGYSLSATTAQPGESLHLTLYWNALGDSGDVEYTVFAHLIDQHSVIWAQQDHPPGNGQDPTTGWVGGEYLTDQYNLTIKPGAPPGTYQIEIGMYDPRTGTRLPVHPPSGPTTANRIILATVQVQ
jgi:uncharacterized membrane protein